MTRNILLVRLSAVFLAFVVTAAAAVAPVRTNTIPTASNSEDNVLNVTIPVFNPGVPADPSVFRDLDVFPRIRGIEAKLMPFLLRETLVESGKWGAVRVVAEPEQAAELQLLGTIIRSDGDWLDLRIRAVDATGAVWLDRVFSDRANSGLAARDKDKDKDKDKLDFQALYTEIATALAEVRSELGEAGLSKIRNTSLVRYASELAPSAFKGYLEQNDDGTYRLLRLPARGDPMLARIEVIRDTEFLITDTVDTKFREFNTDLTHTYRVWRDYRRKFVDYETENVRFAAANADVYQPGSWNAIKHQYDAYKYDRITAQEQDRLAVAFNTEVSTTVEAMEARIAELDGWVERGYLEWRSLLEELYEVETSLREYDN